jgi:hypothetical protein
MQAKGPAVPGSAAAATPALAATTALAWGPATGALPPAAPRSRALTQALALIPALLTPHLLTVLLAQPDLGPDGLRQRLAPQPLMSPLGDCLAERLEVFHVQPLVKSYRSNADGVVKPHTPAGGRFTCAYRGPLAAPGMDAHRFPGLCQTALPFVALALRPPVPLRRQRQGLRSARGYRSPAGGSRRSFALAAGRQPQGRCRQNEAEHCDSYRQMCLMHVIRSSRQ